MTCKPILFNTDMVRAVLMGQKTQTRRVIKPQPTRPRWNNIGWLGWDDGHGYRMKPPCEDGDVLWVRETWSTTDKCGLYPNWPTDGIHYIYKADDPTCDAAKEARWYPSIHMPKQAARFFLRVQEVRVELLQEMTDDDVSAEGAERFIQCPNEHVTYDPDGTLEDMCWNTDCCKVCEYITKSCGELFGEFVWNHTIPKNDLPKYGWDANPWVWVIEFERCEKPEGWNLK